MPLLDAKIAISKDFYTKNKKSRFITNEISRKTSQLLRSRYDCLITTSKTVAKQIQKSLEKLIPNVERSSIVKQSISKNGFIAVCKNQNDVIELANKIAPEHIELMVKNAKTLSKKITGPGLVLIGNNTPSSASDYLLGTNHILPTNGFGKTRGGLSVLDFLKLQTIVETKKSDLSKISDNLKTLTDAEGLPNHYKAVERRLKWIKNSKRD